MSNVTQWSAKALASGQVQITANAAPYQAVAASQTANLLGATGAIGDVLVGVLVIPATVSPGAVSILDGATSISIFTGGANSAPTLAPIFIPLGLIATGAGWSVTTGANVSVIASGFFT